MLSMGNQDIPVGGGIPVHLHEKEEEILFFHEGEAEVEVDGEVYQVKAGMTAFLPVGVTHGLRNTGDVPVKLLWIFSPPGYEEIFPPHVGHRHGPRQVRRAAPEAGVGGDAESRADPKKFPITPSRAQTKTNLHPELARKRRIEGCPRLEERRLPFFSTRVP